MKLHALTWNCDLWPPSASQTWLLWLASISCSCDMSALSCSQSQLTFQHESKWNLLLCNREETGSVCSHGTLPLASVLVLTISLYCDFLAFAVLSFFKDAAHTGIHLNCCHSCGLLLFSCLWRPGRNWQWVLLYMGFYDLLNQWFPGLGQRGVEASSFITNLNTQQRLFKSVEKERKQNRHEDSTCAVFELRPLLPPSGAKIRHSVRNQAIYKDGQTCDR